MAALHDVPCGKENSVCGALCRHGPSRCEHRGHGVGGMGRQPAGYVHGPGRVGLPDRHQHFNEVSQLRAGLLPWTESPLLNESFFGKKD